MNRVTFTRNCKTCGGEFRPFIQSVQRGLGLFCNPFCVRRVKRPLRERFWEKVQRGMPDECWPWLASKTPNGYGKIYRDRQLIHAQRCSWELERGPVPAGLDVCHECDNPPCCNPDHLFLGTAKENVADMIAKGRARYRPMVGESHPRAQLTESLVIELRRRYAAGEGVGALSALLNLPRTRVYDAVRRRSWKHVP